MLTLEAEGLDRAQRILLAIEEISKAKINATLNAKSRSDGKANNQEVLLFLAGRRRDGTRDNSRPERDFFTPDKELMEEIDREMVKILERGIDKIGGLSKLGRKMQVTQGGLKFDNAQALAILGRAYKKAAQMWAAYIESNLENEEWQGSGEHELSEAYGPQKQKAVGFQHPIGTRTGQLLDNVHPRSGNIKINRG